MPVSLVVRMIHLVETGARGIEGELTNSERSTMGATIIFGLPILS